MACVISCPALFRRQNWRPIVGPAHKTRHRNNGFWVEVPGSSRNPGPLLNWCERGNGSCGSQEAEAVFAMESAGSLDGTCRQPFGVQQIGTTQTLPS